MAARRVGNPSGTLALSGADATIDTPKSLRRISGGWPIGPKLLPRCNADPSLANHR